MGVKWCCSDSSFPAGFVHALNIYLVFLTAGYGIIVVIALVQCAVMLFLISLSCPCHRGVGSKFIVCCYVALKFSDKFMKRSCISHVQFIAFKGVKFASSQSRFSLSLLLSLCGIFNRQIVILLCYVTASIYLLFRDRFAKI